MKLIHKFKSPNFNNRKSNSIQFIIIHYTALKSISESIEYLCSKKNKVSCHFLISKNGKIYNLVSEEKRAWHAGSSYWNKVIDINSNSIGIELDYSFYKENNIYEKKLIKSLIVLLIYLKKKYKIMPKNILGHSDIAPYRKIDPGEKFPWKYLSKKKIGYWHDLNYRKLLKERMIDISNLEKIKFIKNLCKIGYTKNNKLSKKKYFKILSLAFQRRYRQELINGVIDQECLSISKNLLKKLK